MELSENALKMNLINIQIHTYPTFPAIETTTTNKNNHDPPWYWKAPSHDGKIRTPRPSRASSTRCGDLAWEDMGAVVLLVFAEDMNFQGWHGQRTMRRVEAKICDSAGGR